MKYSIYFQQDHPALNKAITLLFLIILIGTGTAGVSFGKDGKKEPLHIVFLISEDPDNYKAHLTIPEFANYLAASKQYKTTVLKGESNRTSYRFPNFEILKEADLVVVFARRLALASDQMAALKNYLKRGAGLVGIRTANHAFTLLGSEKPADGYAEWPEFVSDVLGCLNRGYGVATAKTEVLIKEGQSKNEILHGIKQSPWVSDGNLYLVDPLLAKDAQVLLQGLSDNRTEPIAWKRQYGQSRIFYTSLGYPTDFKNKNFITLLENAIAWAINKDI